MKMSNVLAALSQTLDSTLIFALSLDMAKNTFNLIYREQVPFFIYIRSGIKFPKYKRNLQSLQ